MKHDFKKLLAAFSVAPLALACQTVMAQDDSSGIEGYQTPLMLEETIVFGRLKSAAEDVMMERMNHETIADVMSIEQIGRIGASSVADALRSQPGVTLVEGKFIYIRGLGERYSSATLNGAAVPSPDLTRSVIPLDIFPTSILRSISVQKGYTADMPAAFGGGNIDIRTKGIPSEPIAKLELSIGQNSLSDDFGFDYSGGGDSRGAARSQSELPSEVSNALATYRGSLSVNDILALDQARQGTLTIDDARQINRQIATSLDSDLALKDKNLPIDQGVKLNLGNSYLLSDDLEVGFLVGGSYSSQYRNQETTVRNLGAPDRELSIENRTTHTVNLTGNVVLGAKLDDENQIDASYIFIRNSDDEAQETDIFTDNRPFGSGNAFRETQTQFEQRELEVVQFTGTHRLNDTMLSYPVLGALKFLEDLKFDWYISDAEATTNIPGAYNISESSTVIPETGQVTSSSVEVSQRMVEYRFTDLVDNVDSSGFEFTLPLEFGSSLVDLSFGQDFVTKARSYLQTDLFIGSAAPVQQLAPILGGTFSDVFANENLLNPLYGFELALNSAGARSYLAAVQNDAAFGQVDFNWNETFRVVAGLRWESYNQVGLPWQPYNFSGSQLPTDPQVLEEAVFAEDSYYPSISTAWMKQDFLGAADWQLRFSASETVVRPDLREITETSYQDPLTDFLVSGNADVRPSDVSNYDVRAEWFFEDDDNLTFSLFLKDIQNPIEFFELPASDNKRAAGVRNAQSAEVYGLEIEWLQGLGDRFFVSGNATFASSEMTDVEGSDVTNRSRPLKGASDQVYNLQLGYDSPAGGYSATLIYNVFSERVFSAGRNGTPDAYEQPFNSLDLTYSWYPYESERIKVSAKVQNLLDEDKSIEQEGVEVFTRTVGTSASLSFQVQY